jgi:serine/threonine protein kinase
LYAAEFQHPNIVQLLAHFVERPSYRSGYGPYRLVLVFPLLQKLPTPFVSSAQLLSCARDLLHALAFLHSCGVVHLDVKPTNMLYEPSKCRFVLCDMGSACFEAELPFHVPCSTEQFAAPEVSSRCEDAAYRRKHDAENALPYNETLCWAADIYAVGVTLSYLLNSPEFGGRALLTAEQAQAVDTLILQMTREDAMRRPTAAEALHDKALITGKVTAVNKMVPMKLMQTKPSAVKKWTSKNNNKFLAHFPLRSMENLP